MNRPRIAMLLAMLLPVAACGGDDDGDTTAAPEEAPVTTEAAAPATEAEATTTTAAAADTTAGDATGGAGGATACQGKTLTFIGLAGEEGDVELADWRAANDVTLESTWPGDWPEMIAAISVGQVFDLGTIPYHQAQRMIASGILQPLDVSRLTHWEEMVPGLREHPSLRGPADEIYGAPIAWGDGPYVYHPDRVDTPPVSILDLAQPEWQDRFTMFDTPDVYYYIALANGFTDSPLLTPEQLATVEEQAAGIVANAAAFNEGYQDATDRLVAGDIDLVQSGWEAMLTWAAEDGVTLEFGFYEESPGGWYDGLAIPTTADDVDCAYEYIDMMLSPEVNALVGTNLISAVVNENAIELVGEQAQIYDYSIVLETGGDIFESSTPPEDPPMGIAPYQDWLDSWQRIKAG